VLALQALAGAPACVAGGGTPPPEVRIASEGPSSTGRAVRVEPRCLDGDLPGCTANCDTGNLEDCAAAAAILYRGEGAPKDYDRAYALADHACSAGVMRGCNTLALLLEEGHGAPKDEARALSLFRMACERQQWRACFNLATRHYKGESLGLAPDLTVAISFFERACNVGPPSACTDGAAYLSPRQPHVEATKAAELFRRACDRGDLAGCNGLGACYGHGTGVPRDDVRARELFQRGCDGNLGIACKGLGDVFADTDAKRARELYRRACELGYARACDLAR
jgi:TPR repeat protein